MSALDDLHASLAARRCAARGCGRPSRPNGFFCSDACRARTWKENNPGYRSPAGQHTRQNAAERPSRVSNRGGLQVSAEKMVRVLTGHPWVFPELQARRAVREALSERQRSRWAA